MNELQSFMNSLDPNGENTAGLVAIAVCTTLLLFVSVVPIALDLILPGPKGHLKTVKEQFLRGRAAADIYGLFVERLQFEGFEILEADAPRSFSARREPLEGEKPWPAVHTHDKHSYVAEFEFTDYDGGVAMSASLKIDALVLRDTGEGEYIRLTLDRLVAGDLANEPLPVVPNETYFATVGVWYVLLSVLCLPLAFIPWFENERTKGLFLGSGLGFVMGLICIGIALRAIRTNPHKLKLGKLESKIIPSFLQPTLRKSPPLAQIDSEVKKKPKT